LFIKYIRKNINKIEAIYFNAGDDAYEANCYCNWFKTTPDSRLAVSVRIDMSTENDSVNTMLNFRISEAGLTSWSVYMPEDDINNYFDKISRLNFLPKLLEYHFKKCWYEMTLLYGVSKLAKIENGRFVWLLPPADLEEQGLINL
jgi:hypothetical protein